MKLVIIEGPGKEGALKKYLGSGYDVMATKGHVRDLPTKDFAIDLKNNYQPQYAIMPDKKAIISQLKSKAEKADEVLLATDPDREGEAISWHIAQILNLEPEKKCRVVFNEISEKVVNDAVKSPRSIDLKLVDAQQARRVLDRLVGYKISPIICKKIRPRLSAGRVQSVALRLIVERENEIKSFVPEEYWNIFAMLSNGNDNLVFKSQLTMKNGKKFKVGNQSEVEKILEDIDNQSYIVKSIKRTTTKSHAPAPFITSSMQQDAQNKLGFKVAKTSKIAQVLYEGVDLGAEGKTALITYIRTDSTRVSDTAMASAKSFIIQNYGQEYVPSKYNIYAKKSNAQDAHEAIRPISMDKTPEKVKQYLTPDAYRLYKLIFERFLASQMSEAIYNNVVANINCVNYTFVANGKTQVFAGFTSAYKNYDESEKESNDFSKIPNITENQELKLDKITHEQKFTKPPVRFTEGSLVKTMEDKGIGRPATYAATMITLTSREYVKEEGKYLVPTELGEVITKFLIENFEKIMNTEFTANMETNLDMIAEGNKEWTDVIDKFWHFLMPLLSKADENALRVKIQPIETDIVCDKCGAKMVVREGKFGKFLGCSNYPQCKNIMKDPTSAKPEPKVVSKCPKCGGDIVARKSKRGKLFYACNQYPKCDFISWDKPTGELCPKCKSFLVETGSGDKKIIKCSNSECNYTND